MTEYRTAPEVDEVAREVMAEDHALLYQRGPRIEWVMTAPSKPGARLPDWKIRKVTGIYAYLSCAEKPEKFGGVPEVESFLAIEVSERWWGRLDEKQREGFCDHVLSYFRYDHEKGRWTVEGPEFGEFSEVLERRGFWRPDDRLQRFAETMSEQLTLFMETNVPDTEGPEPADDEPEPYDVSITHQGTTVHTNSQTLNKLAEGDFLEGPSGEKIDAETGEVLEGVR